MKDIGISIFFPAFNEEENIESVVLQSLEVLSGITSNFEVIVVNDGSVDQTRQISEKLAEQYEQIKVVNHTVNRGYGAALRTGFAAATMEYIFFVDGDRQFDLSELSLFLPWIEDFDIVTGFRIKRKDPFIRSVNAFGWKVLNRILLGINVRDINCAFKCFKKSVFEVITLTTDGAMINAEIYAQALRHSLTIKEIGVHHYPRQAGTQTGANLKVITNAFRELIRIKNSLK